MVIDNNLIDTSYVAGPYEFNIEQKTTTLLINACRIEGNASNSEEQQKAASQLSKVARSKVTFSGPEISFYYYFLEIPKELEDYAELLISNANVQARYVFPEIIQDVISQPDCQERLMELISPQLKEGIANILQNTIGGA